jgi:DnaD/phage-associated family protein
MGKRYKVFPLRAIDKAEFFDATAEELRLLIALIERGGDADEEALAKSSKITLGRCRASLRFWADAGIISKESASDVEIIDEYPEVVNRGELIEESGVKVAEDIRNNNLKPLFDELAVIFERNLTTAEAKIVSGVVEQYGVSTEYVATLAAHLKGTRGFTVAKLRDRAIILTDKGIDTLEALEIYIAEREKELKCEWEIKGILGIYDRNLSPTERKYFKAWSDELGFSGEIIREAYDITVMQTGGRSLPYMNEILLSWSKAGLKTPEECREYSEKTKPEAKGAPSKRKPKEIKPRYGNFDIDEAFANALQRSYGEESEKK